MKIEAVAGAGALLQMQAVTAERTERFGQRLAIAWQDNIISHVRTAFIEVVCSTILRSEWSEDRQDRHGIHDPLLQRLYLRAVDDHDIAGIDRRIGCLATPDRGQVKRRSLRAVIWRKMATRRGWRRGRNTCLGDGWAGSAG